MDLETVEVSIVFMTKSCSSFTTNSVYIFCNKLVSLFTVIILNNFLWDQMVKTQDIQYNSFLFIVFLMCAAMTEWCQLCVKYPVQCPVVDL